MKTIPKLRGWFRMMLGLCPECNSDAPEIDNCQTCKGWRGTFPPSKDIKLEWKHRFNIPRCIHGALMSEYCIACQSLIRPHVFADTNPRRG